MSAIMQMLMALKAIVAAGRSDNFTRANSTTSLGTPSDGGSGYSVETQNAAAATWGISSNRAYYTGSNGTIVTTAALDAGAGVSNAYVQATILAGASNSNYGLTGRWVDGANNLYAHHVTGFLQVGSRVAGAGNSFATIAYTPANGDVWKLEIDSSNTIKLWINGVLKITTSSTDFTTATKWGMMIRESSGTTMWDNLTIVGV